ncbi:MAG: hypothetical protein ACYDH3_00265 [Candidatus Aminicenantales bacterium]
MTKFVWLRDSAFPRTGPRLEKGKEHDAAAYGPGVVDEWVRTGAAQMVAEAPPEKAPEKEKKAVRKPAGGER